MLEECTVRPYAYGTPVCIHEEIWLMIHDGAA